MVRTEPPARVEAVDPTVAGRLDREISRLGANGRLAVRAEEKLAVCRARLPAGAYADEFIDRMRSEIAARATDLARGLINEADHAAD